MSLPVAVAPVFTNHTLREPLWRLETQLSPLERDLLTSKPVRRLRFLHHNGASVLTTPFPYDRLQHVLGVFSLIAHFAPDNAHLRAAALLHDIGHAPFSHTLERLPEVDHHQWTRQGILSSPVVDMLEEYGLDPERILAYVDGSCQSPLRNRQGILHCDHLDSFVRSGQALGLLPLPPHELLSRLVLAGPHVSTDLPTAEWLVDLIATGARFHGSPENLGPDAVLEHLVRQLLDAGALRPEDMRTMTDSELEHLLFSHPETGEEAQALWYEPHRLELRRPASEGPAGGYRVGIKQLYLAVPLVQGEPVTARSAAARARVEEAQKVLGDYLVRWA